MINIGENNEFSFLRNHNFSSTIVLELKRTDTAECQCIGVVFDVEIATNEISRMFFWHKGPLLENEYRTVNRSMSTEEVKEYLQSHYAKEDCYYGSHNERFRKQLYDIYLGGLDSEKFPQLFKRAIPFRMNIKLEEFVKEYICMEQDIHIEDMQESVMQYGRMRKKIEDTYIEIEKLKEIRGRFEELVVARNEKQKFQYFVNKMDIFQNEVKIKELLDKIQLSNEDLEWLKKRGLELETKINDLTEQSDKLLRQIASSGYDDLKNQLISLNMLIERLVKSKVSWEQTANHLKVWIGQDVVTNQIHHDIEKFINCGISKDELNRLRKDLAAVQNDIKNQQQEAMAVIRDLRKNEQQLKEELDQLKSGNKAYPKELEMARLYIQRRLSEEHGEYVQVEILADLLDIRDDKWRNAVEGYMANNKLALIVEPKYARDALRIYGGMDKEKYHRIAILDTEKVGQNSHKVLQNALAEEVTVERSFIQPYIHFLLGKVMKCKDIDELRNCKIGITTDCVLYHSYRMQHINPDHYTRFAYIGKNSLRQRIQLLENNLETIQIQLKPQETIIKECKEIQSFESLIYDARVYLDWQQDIVDCKEKEREQQELRTKLEILKVESVDAWEKERQTVQQDIKRKTDELRQNYITTSDRKKDLVQKQHESIVLNEELSEKKSVFEELKSLEEELKLFLEEHSDTRYEKLKDYFTGKLNTSEKKREEAYEILINTRSSYLHSYPNRNYSLTGEEDNNQYGELLQIMECDRLEEYRRIADEQARSAVEHFKDDFIFKIRSAIREALQRKDELNRIISRLDFGKDKYKFVIEKNKGIDGQYYNMFMDESLEVNPTYLVGSMDKQMDLFAMKHENDYRDLINDLISIFIPPDNATREQLEEAKRNMAKYADYRTYLSFDMQQLIENEEETIKIGLSKMIKKNSGGEGQNPLYVALLASFAQAYRINLSPRIQRNPTIRLVVLDEAFSKMDAEKVASCIALIRGLGFQALISATNDKIQNYLENVNKIFVYANPNKKSISIQEFEKSDFDQLVRELDESYDSD
ncbi:ATP-binding protein [Paenibacillus sp. FSL P4-0288]